MTDQEPGEKPDEWDPEPASLREGETPDVSSHAARNIEQIRRAVEDGLLDEEEGAEAVEDIRKIDQEAGSDE